MSSIIRAGDTFHGISVFGRGVFTNKDGGRTYAGQCKDGYACGLGVVMWSDGLKDYAEHGPDGQFDGRFLDRDADGTTGYYLYERGKQKDSAYVSADGNYSDEACAPDDPRLLALIALVAPVEVRRAAPAPHPPSPATRPQSIVRYAGSFCPPQALATAVATEVHPLAADRRNVPCGTFQQQPHCKARPRNDACMYRFDVAVAWVAQKHFPSCSLTAAAWCTRGPVEAASLPCLCPAHCNARRAARLGAHAAHTPRSFPLEPSCRALQFCHSDSVLAGRGSRGQPAAARGGARALRPTKFDGVHVEALNRRCMGTHGVLTAYSRGLPPPGEHMGSKQRAMLCHRKSARDLNPARLEIACAIDRMGCSRDLSCS
jgi:hypothetical protein